MKERLLNTAKSFFISTVLINIAIFVCGMVFQPEQSFGYKAYLYPLLYGLLTSVPCFILYTEKELTVRQTVLREVIRILLIIAIIEVLIFTGQEMTQERVFAAIFIAVSVVAVYAGVILFMYLLSTKKARNMTEELKQYQMRQ